MSRPVIAVTTSQLSGWRVFPLVALNVWLAGGRALRWGVGRAADLPSVDGLIIGGGDDISPALYGQTLRVTARLDARRDTLERRLAEEALAQGVPVLGICRGAQMLNVALQGTLEQDAWSRLNQRKITTILPKRNVHVVPDTHLSRIAGTEPMRVNALHSQAVDDLGIGMRVCARDEHGMVQAVERASPPFALGVQWHPEHLFYARRQRALFRALVEAAQAGRKRDPATSRRLRRA
ncbi:gamma-glutamyl-gamma-aminobutyrate hydrolase family protein [Citreimonas salinaria]|uniref:Putative glutamine amidotransferase n=1 Tax=Citreimonas salinaria TaxID=321339 RepID=A0A1H3F8V1_9RHOB|nr:gamma-glutamyl-gamma-aminobutyrate hydrolase family protein [Citreimonas salinaria]SDX87402.1 putative glutamine amidotransferase [Citreimonas salinaria]